MVDDNITDAANEAPKAAADAAENLKSTASKLGKQAADTARNYADQGKVRATGALDEVSRLMGDAATTVDEKLGSEYGKYARTAADTISGWSEHLKSKELDDFVNDARDLVRKSPAVAIGVAAALGFVVARLIRSGTDDRA
ncbi:hypothetical protein ACLB0R_09925 [Sphingomonas sp. GlSt437]|uniref:hypothetical protein n=1 Tax=Sphingomonas sp. GlSt437 TaxID=3389970 RepID=UPI003A8B4F6C